MSTSIITILLTTSPYENNLTVDYHNVILSSSAFFDKVIVIFMTEESCYQLYDHNPNQSLGYKNILKSLRSFEWYDIEKIYILDEIAPKNIDRNLPFSIITKNQILSYIDSSSHCLVY